MKGPAVLAILFTRHSSLPSTHDPTLYAHVVWLRRLAVLQYQMAPAGSVNRPTELHGLAPLGALRRMPPS